MSSFWCPSSAGNTSIRTAIQTALASSASQWARALAFFGRSPEVPNLLDKRLRAEQIVVRRRWCRSELEPDS